MMQQLMEEINNKSGAASGTFASFVNDNSGEQASGDSLCTRDRNIQDAMDNIKMLQDLTITTGLLQHTQIDTDRDGGNQALRIAEKLKDLKDIDVKEIIDKRFAELVPSEKVVLTLHLINQQVGNIDNIVSRVCADQEQDFLNAYSGHMGMVMRELKRFKQKIYSQQFEMKKNTQIKNLQAEVDYFQEEALHFRELDKEQQDHIKTVHNENEGLRDDSYVLRQALLNTKMKQRKLEKQLEDTKNNNLELIVQVQTLQTELREQVINFQKQQVVSAALTGQAWPQAITYDTNRSKAHTFAGSSEAPASDRIANIRLNEQPGDENGGDQWSSVEHGGEIVSLGSQQRSNTVSISLASDEQGIRSFLHKMLNSRHMFTTSDMVDQIEAFIQIKIDKCNQMIASFRDRLSRQEKETKRVLLENKKLSSDQFNVQKAFKECIDQLKQDKKTQDERMMYQNQSLFEGKRVSEADTTSASGVRGGQHTHRRVAKRIQSAHMRRSSAANSTIAASNATSRLVNKLSSRNPNPSKGICVLKSRIGDQSQRDNRQQAAVEPIDNLDKKSHLHRRVVSGGVRRGRNSIGKTFQTLDVEKSVPLVGPSPEQVMNYQTNTTALNSPVTSTIHNQLETGAASSTVTSSRMAAHEKRAVIENFLKDEQVFRLLYDTVFTPNNDGHTAHETLMTQSQGQTDVQGNRLPTSYVNQVSDANENLFEAVIAGTKMQPSQQKSHRRAETQRMDGAKSSGAFFINNQDGLIAIEENHMSHDDEKRKDKSNSQTFFVTLQDATNRQQASAEPYTKQSSPGINDSATHTLRGSHTQAFESPREGNAMLAIEPVYRHSTEEVEQNHSKEVEDEVNQLEQNHGMPIISPLAQAASNGNLNVQTLIDQSKNLGAPTTANGKPVRPQSSRPMFRRQFMTLDPSQQRLNSIGQSGIDSMGALRLNSEFKVVQEADSDKSAAVLDNNHMVNSEHQRYASNPNLEQNQASSNKTKLKLPGPSLMMKDRSDYIYHMLEMETRGLIKQQAVNQKNLSPRSSKLLASRHFMNRNSTAGSSGFRDLAKPSSEGSSLMPQAFQNKALHGTIIGRTRPMSSKIPKGQSQVNQKFKQQRQRLGSAKIRSNLPLRGGMFNATVGAPANHAQFREEQLENHLVMRPAILSQNSSALLGSSHYQRPQHQ